LDRHRGWGLNRFDGRSFLRFSEAEGLGTYVMTWATRGRKGSLWFGTMAGALGLRQVPGREEWSMVRIQKQDGLIAGTVHAILETRSGYLWFGSEDGGATRFDGRTFARFNASNGLSGNSVGTLFEDREGRIWFGMYDGGVTVFDPALEGREGAFVQIRQTEGLLHDQVISIHQDRDGAMWLGTQRGAMRLRPTAHRHEWEVDRYTESDGMVNNVVLSMLEDREGHMWFGTRFGVSRLNEPVDGGIHERGADEPLFLNLTYEDGFQGVGCLSNAMIQRADGRIWIGGNGRLSIYAPRKDEQIVAKPPPEVAIIGVDIYNERVPWERLMTGDRKGGKARDTLVELANGVHLERFRFSGLSAFHSLPQALSLAHDNNHITLRYGAINLDQAGKVKYRYILEGVDEQWSGVTGMTGAPYGNLPHGSYTFKVQALDANGRWSGIASYTFTIRPPWWKTWWFRGSMVLLIIGSVAGYVKWREWGLRQRQKELEHLVDTRTAELKEEKLEVERQKERSEELLLNILPAEVAEELKAKGEADAVQIEQVTVLFTDFKGFTEMSAKVTPKELVKDLHECFSAFDHICAEHGLEKIKTIGDAYMAAGGLPVPNTTHPRDVLLAALEMRDFIATGKARKIAAGQPYFEIRIGIHTGPVVAGIVGVKKFQYDIWGDTVNTASRMESSGEVGRVNISEATYALVKDAAIDEDGSTQGIGLGNNAVNDHRMRPAFTFTPRGKVQAKGKGEMAMYFVEHSAVIAGIRPE
jgi:class 3 adenylate cyclase